MKKEPWFVIAEEYAKSHEIMLQNDREGKGTALQDLAVREDAGSQLLKVTSPSVSELVALLNSNDPIARKVALVNVMLREIKDTNVLEAISKTYRFEDDTYTKFFSVGCLAPLSAIQVQALDKRLLEIFASEKDQNIIIAALPVLTKLDPIKSRALFTRYLTTGTKALRASTIVTLQNDRPEVLYDIDRELKSQGINIFAGLTPFKIPEKFETAN